MRRFGSGYTQHHFLISTKSQKLKSGAGYTLVEMLVTVAIFALAFTAIGAIFIGFTTAQSSASSAQKLLNEGSFILESITREIRSTAIDYNCVAANPALNHTYLCLRSVDGRSVHFRFDDPAAQDRLQVCIDY